MFPHLSFTFQKRNRNTYLISKSQDTLDTLNLKAAVLKTTKNATCYAGALLSFICPVIISGLSTVLYFFASQLFSFAELKGRGSKKASAPGGITPVPAKPELYVNIIYR